MLLGQTRSRWLLPTQTWGLDSGCHLVGVPASSFTRHVGYFLPPGGSLRGYRTQGPLPSAAVPPHTFWLWWQLLLITTWLPPARGDARSWEREMEAPHSTPSKAFLPLPYHPQESRACSHLAHLSWEWNGVPQKQPFFLRAHRPVGEAREMNRQRRVWSCRRDTSLSLGSRERVPEELLSAPNLRSLQRGLHRVGKWGLGTVSRRGKTQGPFKEMKEKPHEA